MGYRVLINRDMLVTRGELERFKEVEMTPVQSEVFLIIDEWWKKYGYAPSYRDIAYVRGVKSPNGVKNVVDRLVRLGVVKRLDKRSRSVRPVTLKFKNIN